jgi:hypothetical protein
MRREAPRTLFTLSTRYQMNVAEQDYEVIVVENGSSVPLGEQAVKAFGRNFRYIDMGDDALSSPCHAINHAVAQARGNAVGLMIDGARMASPGLVCQAIQGLALSERSTVATLAWHIGPKPQSLSITEGYCQEVEDRLLESIGWQENGYNLFNISALAWSSSGGYFSPIAESNAFFLPTVLFHELAGYDEAFISPGGGYANLDFFKRSSELPGVNRVMLLGEGTFHQIHGGITTNAVSDVSRKAAAEEYVNIRKCNYSPPEWQPLYIGRPVQQAIRWITREP